MTKLYLATVDHETVPGTRVALFHSTGAEPSDKEIKRRIGTEFSPRHLMVSGLFDLSHALRVDPESRRALARFIADGGMSTEL